MERVDLPEQSFGAQAGMSDVWIDQLPPILHVTLMLVVYNVQTRIAQTSPFVATVFK